MTTHTFDTTLDFGDLWDGPRKAVVKYKRDGSMIILTSISLSEVDSTNYLDVISPSARERLKRKIELVAFDLDTVADAIFDWDTAPGSAS